jgi:Flp pilus assembly protein TadD
MNRNQRRVAAKTAKNQSSLSATTPDSLCELGFAFLKSGQVAEADRCCRQALMQQPNFADALHLMGIIDVSRQRYHHAVEWIAGALRQTPKPEYLHSFGNALQLLGRLETR